MLWGFTFRATVHFEFIFEYGVRCGSSFIYLHVAVQLSRHRLLKGLSLCVGGSCEPR